MIYKASMPCSHQLETSFSNLFYHFIIHLPMNFFILHFITKIQRWTAKGRTDLKTGCWWKHLGIKDCEIYYSPAILFLILFDWMTATSSIILLLKWKSFVSLLRKNNIKNILWFLTFRSTSQWWLLKLSWLSWFWLFPLQRNCFEC